MDRLHDSVALNEFQENATAHLRRIMKSKRPAVLMRGRRAAAVVMSPEAYDRLQEAAAFSESVRRVKVALREFDQGRGRPAAEVMRELRAKYGKPRRRSPLTARYRLKSGRKPKQTSTRSRHTSLGHLR